MDKINTGDTAWMLTSTALVLMMTIPGLALFYGGMVRKKNVLATLMQSFAITCLVTVLWVVVGYSLAFTQGGSFIGGFDRFFLNGMVYMKDAGKLTVSHLGSTIPESVYMIFQMTFAIITPALIAGAFADRMKFSAMLWFMGLWSLLVYSPIAHWVWEPSGCWAAKGVLDFAGGTVVHINAGIAGLVCALVLGKRLGYGKETMAPHNLTLTLDRRVAAVGGLVRLQRRLGGCRRRPRRHGDVRHAVRHRRRRARLDVHRVAGQRQAVGARHRLGRGRRPGGDHPGVGLRGPDRRAGHRHRRRRGLLLRRDHGQEGLRLRRLARRLRRALHRRHRRRLLTGVFNVKEISGADADVLVQLGAVATTLVYSGVGSFIILKIIDVVIGLRVTEEQEREGLDISLHGERVE